MRGEIRREGSFTLSIEWCAAEKDVECYSCFGTIEGEMFTLSLPSGTDVVLCLTCADELKNDLNYAMD